MSASRASSQILMPQPAFPGRGQRVLITGSTGLIGSALTAHLVTRGYEVRGLTRGKARSGLYHWDPAGGQLDAAALEGVHAVVHLAGENIAGGRWTAARKRRILDSRVGGTRTLVAAMARMAAPPAALVCASGVNIYPCGAGACTEASAGGTGFLADVCRQWEDAALSAQQLGVRVVCLRTGVVLDPRGGALAKLLPVFRLGLGGPIGNGRQGFPWIGINDLVLVYERMIRDSAFAGPVNAVHPSLASQREFSRALGRALRRPAVLPLPELTVRLLFGQMGEETLLCDLKVLPDKLVAAGHRFRYAGLDDMISEALAAGSRNRNL